VIGWGTLQLIDVFTGGGEQARRPVRADCAAKAPAASASTGRGVAVPKPAQITVNVYNATPAAASPRTPPTS
jgi:hypothetical protein